MIKNSMVVNYRCFSNYKSAIINYCCSVFGHFHMFLRNNVRDKSNCHKTMLCLSCIQINCRCM